MAQDATAVYPGDSALLSPRTSAMEAPFNSQNSSMRNRMHGRAAAFGEGTSAGPPLPRRRSSMFSISSIDEARRSIRSSTDNLLLPRVTASDERIAETYSKWQSLPLVLAIVPAVGGLFFAHGSSTLTDILLLGLSAVFLNWSLRLPWEWYRDTQAITVRRASNPPAFTDSTIIEESSEDGKDDHKGSAELAADSPTQAPEAGFSRPSAADKQQAAFDELRRYELLALIACFLCPALGAYLLHFLRTSLTRRSEELVSDFNITIFLLAAEMRPISHVLKMMQARTLYLQRVAQPDAVPSTPTIDAKDQLDLHRLEELERQVADMVVKEEGKAPDTTKMTKDIRSSLQTDLDALNRAVRRYEKRFTTQSFQTQARFEDIEKRLNDTLSLAAAAAQGQRKPGIVAFVLDWLSTIFTLPLQAAYATVVYPLQLTLDAFAAVQLWLVGAPAARKKASFAKRDGKSAVDIDRMQSRRLKR